MSSKGHDENPAKRCRSVGPKGQACEKARGHKGGDEAFSRHGHRAGLDEWYGGIKTPAKPLRVRGGDDDMSEGDRQSWGRISYRGL
jgi:hypothetical protein